MTAPMWEPGPATNRDLQPVWYTDREVAVLLGITIAEARFYIQEGHIRSLEFCGRLRVLPSDLAVFVAQIVKQAEDDGSY